MKDKKVENVKVDESQKKDEVKKVEETQEEKEMKDWDDTRHAIPIIIVIFLVLFLLIKGYSFFNSINKRMNSLNKRLPETELVLAAPVRRNNVKQIKKILKEHPEIVEESKTKEWIFSIMVYALLYKKYDAVKALLEEGYNPDYGGSAIGLLVGYDLNSYMGNEPWISEDNIKYIELLLQYNAQINISNVLDFSYPLASSVEYLIGDEKEFPVIRLFVDDYNCDVNYTGCQTFPAACYALKFGYIHIAHYLIVQHKTDLTDDYVRVAACSLLSELKYEPGSEEEKLKEEIIQEVKNQGIDYEGTPEFAAQMKEKFNKDLWEIKKKKNSFEEYSIFADTTAELELLNLLKEAQNGR